MFYSSLLYAFPDVPIAEAESRPKSAHRYNVAEQQQIYKSEIERIWKAQYDSLSRQDEPDLTDEDERQHKQKLLAISAPTRDSPAAFSRASSLEREGSLGPDGSKKVLRIKRLVRTKPSCNPCLCLTWG